MERDGVKKDIGLQDPTTAMDFGLICPNLWARWVGYTQNRILFWGVYVYAGFKATALREYCKGQSFVLGRFIYAKYKYLHSGQLCAMWVGVFMVEIGVFLVNFRGCKLLKVNSLWG